MESEINIPPYLGFSDLNSFKDYVTTVLACAPELFPEMDWLPPDQQLNLERSFEGLEIGYSVTALEVGDIPLLKTCRKLTAEALDLYRAGGDFDGQKKLEDVERLIRSLPSK